MRASPTQPLPVEARTRQLTRMYEGLRALETAPQPTPDDWRVCSDAVNLIETLVGMGVVEDASGLLADAITALAMAGKRHKAGHALRLDAPGIKAVRAVLEDYAAVIAQLPARTVIQAHRATEKRIHDILRGRNKPHDVTISSL
jgi:uncharacterized protein YyaL (SSP411 family)